MPQYGEAQYWEQRYTREPSAFDWYQGFTGLSHLITKCFPLEAKLLQVGVGTSRLQEEMVRCGYRSITNIDSSKVVIAHMAELHKHVEQLTYQVADARSMPEFRDHSYDGVIDKGTLDAILCGEESAGKANNMVAECCRVLRPGGCLMLVTYGDPASRLAYLQAPALAWKVEVYCITKQESHDNLATFNDLGRAVIKGPYPSNNLDCMDALSGLENMHFVYVCTKEGGSEGDAAADAAATALATAEEEVNNS